MVSMTVLSDSSSALSAPVPERMTTRARLVLFVLCAANFMVALDFSILNVALPTLGRGLGISQASLQWAVTAFALPSGGFLLLAGRIADLIGRRRMFLSGLALFTAASLLATLAWDPAVFLAARAAQGLGAAMIVPTAMALLTTSFAEGRHRDRALGVLGTLMSLGFTAGVVFGGVLTDTLGWRSTMGLNVVMGVLVLIAAPVLLNESRGERQRLDLPGAVAITGGLLALIYALSTAAQRGWARPDVITALAAAAALLAAFFVVESRTAQPLVSLPVLRRRTVAWGNLGGLTTFAMESTVIFLCTLYLQQVRGYSPMTAGLIFGVLGLGAVIGGVAAPRTVGRLGARAALPAGLFVQGVLTAAIATLGASDGVILLLIAGTAAAFGHMHAIVSYGITATSGLSDDEQGLATGLVTTAQQVGITIGIPLLSALASARAGSLRAAGRTFAQATLGGVRLGLAVDAGVVLAVALLIAVFLGRARVDASNAG
jgi:EmrB/QacA subfamily drug resistance transporter